MVTAAPSSPDVDVVCLGESMVTFVPRQVGRLADVPTFDRGIGGAESNVACCLARAGHSARWVSRVGADGFGDHLVAAVAATGVDTAAVQRDTTRPTGVYFRTAGERAVRAAAPAGGSEVVYYRAGSAAAAMAPGAFDRATLWSGRVLHLSGITAALSADCLALMRELTTPATGRPLLSFDVNYRVGLWRGRGAADQAGPEVLADLARGCDLVFVGEDEAEAAWGLSGPEAVRAALPEPSVLVVKHGAEGVTVYARESASAAAETTAPPADTVTYAPALRVDVVASVGAGDAFAAGFLSATLRDLPVFARIRHGHLMAAAALTVPGDLGTPPSRAQADRLAALDPDAWGALRLSAGWTEAEPGAEVPTVGGTNAEVRNR
ncbi:sugar kinase [Streptomyces sp. 71268]|uniref:sugar kinase n=1 Tax=Streptomyces sp. 71268 TaxID=3002640 RepID=UPI0023F6D80E|nr:sugar kinase [Streptomyces sp. 71268]WEV29722.1 sugar kinase [Streptomyces sp. 71268]